MTPLKRRTKEEILTPQVLTIINKVCKDYNMPVEEVLCKTCKHKASKVKKIITYILFNYYKIHRFDLALIMYVDPVTIWSYIYKITVETMHDNALENKFKKYTLENGRD